MSGSLVFACCCFLLRRVGFVAHFLRRVGFVGFVGFVAFVVFASLVFSALAQTLKNPENFMKKVLIRRVL